MILLSNASKRPSLRIKSRSGSLREHGYLDLSFFQGSLQQRKCLICIPADRFEANPVIFFSYSMLGRAIAMCSCALASFPTLR